MFTLLRTSLLTFAFLSLMTGLVYPLAITGVAQSVFPFRANGSVIVDADGNTRGSELIGQPLSDPRYFFGRPSATAGFSCNPACGAASNMAPSNPELIRAIEERIAVLRATDPENLKPVPTDLVTTSASGLDPQVSEAAALWQVPRIARVRGLEESALNELVATHLESTGFGLGNRSCVNVLKLNLALDRL